MHQQILRTLLGCTPLFTLAAIGLDPLPATAQLVSIPITNGTFTITRGAGTATYSVLPTFLTPAGTISITSGNAPNARFQALTTINTDTPASAYLPGLSGSANLSDSRTATFAGTGIAVLRGTATTTDPVTGNPKNFAVATSATGTGSGVPTNTRLAFTVNSGNLSVPATSLSAYATPQFVIPVSGGSFTILDNPGTGFSTMTIHSLLTPSGTTNVTMTTPLLNRGSSTYTTSTTNTTVEISGMMDGAIALNDGRTATLTHQFVAVTGIVKRTTGADFKFNQTLHNGTTTLTGTFTGGSIRVPESAVAFPAPPAPPVQPVQPAPPALLVSVTPAAPLVTEPGQTAAIASAATITLAPRSPQFSFAPRVAQSLNLGGDPEEFLRIVELVQPAVLPENLPEVEQSPLAYSRLHPAVNAYRGQ